MRGTLPAFDLFFNLPMTKIAIFADVQNIYYTCKQAYKKQFNYRTFWQNMHHQGDIVAAYAYAIHKGDDGQHKFQKALKSIGFQVKLKPYIQRSDGSAKGDWDVGIAIDIMETAANVDKVVLLSGDGDFDLLLLRIRELYKVETEVVSVPALTANSLIEAANKHTAIDTSLLL